MKIKNILSVAVLALLSACALNEPDVKIQDTDFPLRLEIDEEGADLPDAEDYTITISFADYLGDLPAHAITLTYELSGEGDFSGAFIDEIVYEYEDEDCVFVREIEFTATTITVPVDADLGTVPEEFEIVVLMNEAGIDATDGEFKLEITGVETPDNVAFSYTNTFEYGILDNDVAGEWVLELEDEAAFASFQQVFGPISPDLMELTFADITGEVKFEFEFEEMKIEVELVEEEEVTECEDGEIETDTENLVIEIEADYDAEDGELELEGSHFNEDDEELDFVMEAEYELGDDDDMIITFKSIIDEDNYEEGEELFSGSISFTLIKD
ncbi:hypothetical protein N6H18_07655 [Reichenbachiella agarivorans]|uniref:Calx-beta domain-containing protein n=1 Tax=Reichenbachiella agarivorans TaxID=2979464 RepID=A0ABY6CTH3_9BACT|nr:hypothetical protein [Reichenbachiella agarivorans]UXP33822.1 hypothetical protein N6H18_07655 [Reichenbachiella agarivorans]